MFVHVDKINDDDPADIAEPELPADFPHRFEIGLENGVFHVRLAHVSPGIDVDGQKRLGMVEKNITRRF